MSRDALVALDSSVAGNGGGGERVSQSEEDARRRALGGDDVLPATTSSAFDDASVGGMFGIGADESESARADGDRGDRASRFEIEPDDIRLMEENLGLAPVRFVDDGESVTRRKRVSCAGATFLIVCAFRLLLAWPLR
jgi:hypothetical protein